MAVIAERPPIMSYSKNEIRYVFEMEHDIEEPGLYLQAYLTAFLLDGSTTILDTWDLKPNSSGDIYLYVQAYLDSVLRYDVPPPNENFTAANNQVCGYQISYREITLDTPDPDWTTDNFGPMEGLRLVIKGGIEKHLHSRNNFFIGYVPEYAPFLTWMPSNRFVYPDEPITLSFLNYFPYRGGANAFYAQVTASDRYLNTYTYNVSIGLDGYIIHMKADPLSLGIQSYISPTDLYWYEVSILDGDSNPLISPYRFYIEYRPVYHYYDLLYQNSLGGFDFARVRGDIDSLFDRTFDPVAGGFNLNEWTSHIKTHETNYTGLTITRKYKADIGYQLTREQQEALIELLVSTKIYHVMNRFGTIYLVPVLTLQKDQDLGYFSEPKKSFPIEWSLAQSNEVYTAQNVWMGDGQIIEEEDGGGGGDDPPPCDAIVFYDLATSLTPVTVGTSFSYDIPINEGTPPYTLSKWTWPGWMDIELVDTGDGWVIRYSGTATYTGTDLPISISVTNDCSSVPVDLTMSVTEEVTVPEITITNVSTCSTGMQTTFFDINGPAGTVLTCRLSISGSIDSGIAASHSYVSVTANIGTPSNDGAANISQIWSPGSTAPSFYGVGSPTDTTLVIPPSGVINVTTYANLENGGTSISAGFSIDSADGFGVSIFQAICGGYSTGG